MGHKTKRYKTDSKNWRAFLEDIQTLTSISLKYTTTYIWQWPKRNTHKKTETNITLNKTSNPQGKKAKEERIVRNYKMEVNT